MISKPIFIKYKMIPKQMIINPKEMTIHDSLISYANSMLQQHMYLHIKGISDIKFIEKIRFMELENYSTDIIKESIKYKGYQETIGILQTKIINNDVKPVHKFEKQIKCDMIVYVIFIHNNNIIIPTYKPYRIINEGDTLTIE